jgi:type I restriction enzyme S subunit
MIAETTHIKTEKQRIPELRFKEFDEKWNSQLLGNVVSKVGSGSTPSGGVQVYQKTGIPFIRSQNVTGNELVLDETHISESINLKMKSSIVKPHDILLNITGGSIGRTCVVPSDFDIGNVNQHVCIIRLKSDYTPRFLQPFLASHKGQKLLYQGMTGSGREGINFQSIRLFKLKLPSLSEQQKIASFLSAVDEKIQQLSKKKTLLEQYKKGVMQELFSGTLRFKDEKGNDYPEWEQKRLKDLVEKNRKIRYGIVQPGKYDPEGRFMIRGQDYSYVKGWADSSEFFKVSEEVEQKYKKARVKSGDLLITIVGAGTGYLEVVPDFLEGANITQTTGRIAIDKSITSPGYVKNYFFSHAGRKEINGYIKGQAQPGLNIGDVEIFKLPFPCLEEQQKIATYLSRIDTKIEAVSNQITQSQTFKKGLLQQMFV